MFLFSVALSFLFKLTLSPLQLNWKRMYKKRTKLGWLTYQSTAQSFWHEYLGFLNLYQIS